MSDGRPVHVQRCTYLEVRNGLTWQCRQPDPHPSGEGHTFPVDAEFGRILHEQTPDWLAATLRDRVVLQRHTQKRADDLQAVALDLAESLAHGGPVRYETGEWIEANAPAVAAKLREDYMGTEHWRS